MNIQKLICIGCPLGCSLTVSIEGEDISVSGNTCTRGEVYAKKEVTGPMRVVTSSVRVKNGSIPRVSVKTEKDIPKAKIFECMSEIRKLEVEAPIRIGDVMIENCAGTGVALVATKNVDCK